MLFQLLILTAPIVRLLQQKVEEMTIGKMTIKGLPQKNIRKIFESCTFLSRFMIKREEGAWPS